MARIFQMLDTVADAAYLQWSGNRLRLPRVIQFPINDICNSKCQMCQIWEQKRGPEITPEEVRQSLTRPMFRKVRGVGVNGGEPTLRNDLADIGLAVIQSLPRLRQISLITNALVETKVKERIEELAQVCRASNTHLGVMVSLDGIGGIHDEVRGRPGNFQSSMNVLRWLSDSKIADSFSVGCTIVKSNAYHVDELLEWCRQHEYYARFRTAVQHQRLYNTPAQNAFEFDEDERAYLANFFQGLATNYEPAVTRQRFYRSLSKQLAYGAPRSSGCMWAKAGVTLNHKAELAYCAVQSKTIGIALSDHVENEFWNNEPHLREIRQSKCDECLHDYDEFPTVQDVATSASQPLKRHLGYAFHHWVPAKVKNQISGILQTRGRQHLLAETRSLRSATERVASSHSNPVSRRILICGWYGTETLGDKAILAGIADFIKRTGDFQVDIASLEPYVTRQTCREIEELNQYQVISLAEAGVNLQGGKYRSLLIGGGPLMSTIAECHDLNWLCSLAQAHGATVGVVGCGVGPLGYRRTDRAIAEILEAATEVILRDKSSAEAARNKLGVRREMQTAVDPAYFWFRKLKTAPHSAPSEGAKVALALREWPVREYSGHRSHLQKRLSAKLHFESELQRLINGSESLNTVPFNFQLVCMHTLAVGGDDRAFYRRLCPGDSASLGQIAGKPRAPREEAMRFASADCVLAMRFHSVVAAVAMEKPLVAIDYTFGGKTRGFLRDLNAEAHMIDPASTSTEDIINRICSATPVVLHADEAARSEKLYLETFERLLNEPR